MPEITSPRPSGHVRKLFEILCQHPDGIKAGDALQKLAASVEMTPFEQGFYASGTRRFEKIIRFATIECVKGGVAFKKQRRLVGHRRR
jgi:restriction system protein